MEVQMMVVIVTLAILLRTVIPVELLDGVAHKGIPPCMIMVRLIASVILDSTPEPYDHYIKEGAA
jgi:hypothetical protein